MKPIQPESKAAVPDQTEGTKKDIEHTITAIDENDARKLFTIARNRLMNVNEWHSYSGGGITAKFQVTDEAGNNLHRTIEKGDFFKIDLPAPGSTEGRGYDWVQVEAIKEHTDPNGPKESIAILVRPASNPKDKGENVAHFFKDQATSSFVLERNQNEVTAAVYGRNEIPNTETSNLVDKVRNAVVGVTAILGFSNVQWKKLVKGLLETH